MLLMEALAFSLSRGINKHTINENTTIALRYVAFFSHTSEPLRTINNFVKARSNMVMIVNDSA